MIIDYSELQLCIECHVLFSIQEGREVVWLNERHAFELMPHQTYWYNSFIVPCTTDSPVTVLYNSHVLSWHLKPFAVTPLSKLLL